MLRPDIGPNQLCSHVCVVINAKVTSNGSMDVNLTITTKACSVQCKRVDDSARGFVENEEQEIRSALEPDEEDVRGRNQRELETIMQAANMSHAMSISALRDNGRVVASPIITLIDSTDWHTTGTG